MSSKNIYAYNLLKANHLNFDKEGSYLLARLLEIHQSILLKNKSIEKVSDYVMNLFLEMKIPLAKKIDRVCFVNRRLNSNHLEIISSATSSHTTSNILVPGYSCYVSEDSSLFKISPSDIRVYNNIEDILQSYHAQNKKVQRSILLLSKSEIKSGITLPLINESNVSGFLFLNSTLSDSFIELSNEDYFILGYLQLIFSSLLSTYLKDKYAISNSPSHENLENRNRIDFQSFKDTLRNFIEKSLCRSNVNITIENIPTRNIIISNVLMHIYILELIRSLDLSKWQEGINLQFLYREGQLITKISLDQNSFIKSKTSLPSFNNVKYEINDYEITMRVDCEEDLYNLKYSTL